MGNLHTPSSPSPVYPFQRSESLLKVYVTLRRLVNIFGSPNHWAVIVETDSGYMNIQFYGNIGVSYHKSFTSAALDNWGADVCDIRSSRYGYAYSNLTIGDLVDYVDKLGSGRFSSYILVFNDCQCFARKIVDFLTGKWVGVFPIEDGPDVLYYA